MNILESDMFAMISNWLDAANYAVVQMGYTTIYLYLEPAIYAALGCSIMITCIMAYFGGVTAPIMTLGQTILKWAAMSVVLLNWDTFDLWVYQVFTNGPVELSRAITGAISTEMIAAVGGSASTGAPEVTNGITSSLDVILKNGSRAASMAYEQSGWFLPKILWLTINICTYTITGYGFALLMLAKCGTGLMLFFAPIPLIGFYFNITRPWLMSWIQQLTNFAFTTVLTTIVLSIFSQIVLMIMPDAGGETRELVTSDVGGLILITIVVMVVLGQVTGQASSLAGGMQLTTMGVVQNMKDRGGRMAGGALGKVTPSKDTRKAMKEWAGSKMNRLKAVKGE